MGTSSSLSDRFNNVKEQHMQRSAYACVEIDSVIIKWLQWIQHIKNLHKFLSPFHSRSGCNSRDAKIQKANYYILIFSVWILWQPCGCFLGPTPPFSQGRGWWAVSPVVQAGLRGLQLALTAGSSSTLGLAVLGLAEVKFSERISPSNCFLYPTFPHFSDLINVVLIL